MSEALNLRDFEALAAERMDPGQFAYYAGGGGDEVTLRANEEAFARRRLLPRVLVDVSDLDTRTTLLGREVAASFGIAPTAQHGLAHSDGECATARAAAAAGVVFCASTMSSRSLEEIASACDAPRWFQLYVQQETDGRTEALVRRAEAAGYEAIVLTVDLAMPGRREREMRALVDATVMRAGNFKDGVGLTPSPASSWKDVEWLRSRTKLPLVVKGVVAPEDAKRAVVAGAAAVWVSNHGGRQLDRTIASLDALEAIVDAVDGRAEVYMDGGVRRGVDVVTAIALGARAVFIGRPILYALACDGEAGVTRALDLLAAEVRHAMSLLGTPSVADIRREHVV